MTTTKAAARSTRARLGGWARSPLRRRLSGLFALIVALMAVGGLYTALAPQPQTATAQQESELVSQGEQLYNNTCISCHGTNLQGVEGRGPSLIGVGEAAVYFQVSTGRMPAVRQEAQAPDKPPRFEGEQIDALGAFIQANGGGPHLPEENMLAGGNSARGGELFRLNCAQCHNWTGRGGALSSGKAAPNLDSTTDLQVYTAMLTGPQNMPTFSDRQLTPQEKADIIAYVDSIQANRNNPGGYALGGFGPIPEGLVAWFVGIGLLVGVTVWIGAKA